MVVMVLTNYAFALFLMYFVAYHHSIVVLDSEPAEATLQEYLFHLRHAYGQKNRPPTGTTSNPGGPHGSLDRVLIPRLNRYIGISREGIVCMTWSTEYPRH